MSLDGLARGHAGCLRSCQSGSCQCSEEVEGTYKETVGMYNIQFQQCDSVEPPIGEHSCTKVILKCPNVWFVIQIHPLKRGHPLASQTAGPDWRDSIVKRFSKSEGLAEIKLCPYQYI